MKVIAIEEHFMMPQYGRKYSEYLTFFYKVLTGRTWYPRATPRRIEKVALVRAIETDERNLALQASNINRFFEALIH